MAKKAKPTKKVVKKVAAKKPSKPAKKASKKPAPKPAAKKKVVKPAAKKTIKKATKPVAKLAKKATKSVVKKATKKVVKVAKKVTKASKPVAKGKATKKVVKPVVKKAASKKVVSKKTIAKKVVAKKIVAKQKAKPVAKPAKKVTQKAKPLAKKLVVKKVEAKVVKAIAKPVVIEKKKKEIIPAVVAKPIVKVEKPLKKSALKKKRELDMDLDDDGKNIMDDYPMIVEYKSPSIRKPLGPTPKPFINKDTRTRYSDVELKEFKALILKKLSEAQRDYELLKSTLSHRDDHGTDDTSPTFKLLEDGSDVLSKEETAHLASRQEKFIQNLQNALIRIENKTYGICRQTGKLISKERLRSVPHATLAIEAKLGQHN